MGTNIESFARFVERDRNGTRSDVGATRSSGGYGSNLAFIRWLRSAHTTIAFSVNGCRSTSLEAAIRMTDLSDGDGRIWANEESRRFDPCSLKRRKGQLGTRRYAHVLDGANELSESALADVILVKCRERAFTPQ
ncbi:hypothetical protein [Burkholderia thailandensis]|uniref:hypothetical protein n=2 Tax=Burkholderia thailandensis TaxID=57975 RepID=UPI00107EC0D9|nr:hypothetical protein [Burkholderia thailandensis]MCS3392991.1 hypothetical protein [Burkholderia thailandensis]MCS6426452.1 hypothetical protein [Burkholderia thailandensis]MCS6454654.1 hypothetical protein [Burkholderia thailandensis]MCS6465668.1 hypothetical protein [Burkholderia thailandensis]MCS6483632.1 hypothetical protein [Burkholderia thailandensis]